MSAPRTALVIGASRALGFAAAEQLLTRGWDVIATVRSDRLGPLQQLAAADERLTVEHLDMTEPDQVTALRDRLADRPLDLLYVNAGIAGDDVPAHEVPTEDFVDVMVTNALSPVRVVEALGPLVAPTGTIAVVSSRQGSISLNERGGHEVYRASKSALNQLMRSYAVRHRADPRTVLLLHPGWVQTELGGPGAPLTVAESVQGLVDVVEKHGQDGGLQFLDHLGQVVAW